LVGRRAGRLNDLLDAFAALARQAGRAILAAKAKGVTAEAKPNASPVTEADRRAEAVIVAGLERLFPGVAIVAEEATAAGRAPTAPGRRFFLVDPLDGTREFVAGRPDYTVNIALVEDGRPAAGVVHAPEGNALFAGADGAAFEFGADGTRRPIRARPPGPRLVAVASRSHRTPATDAFLARLPLAETVSAGSSLKFCALARGDADLYPRFGRTMEWDTAAGDAVLRHAGGHTLDPGGEPLRYGKPGFANGPFIACGAWDDRAGLVAAARAVE